jgi:O-antigen/teichoic acid export membrane protein
MSVTTRPPRVRRQALIVTVASLGSNASSYLFTVVAARLLVPAAFGELSALMAVLVVGVVPAMSVQTGVALRVAALGRGGGRREQGAAVGLGLALGAAVGMLALLAVPVLTVALHLRGPAAALMLPVALVAFPVFGSLSGVLQGRQRFGALALVMGLDTVLRIGGAIAGLVLGRSPAAALAGLAAGALVATSAAYLVCGRPAPARPSGVLLRRVGHAGYATVGLVVLVNLDVILARTALPGHESGVYAVGAVLTKIAYWLPQAVAVILLPRLAHGAGRRAALAGGVLAVVCIDVPVVLGGALFGADLLPLIGGAGYRGEAAPLWLFALTGMLLAVGQLLLYSRLAAGDVRSIAAVWIGVLAEIGLVRWWLGGSVFTVAAAAASVAGFLILAGILVEVGGAGHRDGRGGDPGADGGQHGGLGDVPVGPGLAVPAEPPGDGGGGRDAGSAEHDPSHRPRIHLPHQRTSDEQHHGQHPGQGGHQPDHGGGEQVAGGV